MSRPCLTRAYNHPATERYRVAADAKEGLSAYNTGPKCKKWLEELDGGWEKKMDNVVKEVNERVGVVSTEQLF